MNDYKMSLAVPDSGNSAALGFASGSGIPLDYGFIRNHYIGRTFIMPKSGQRADSVDLKLAVVADVVRNKRVIVVDDSIIRGTTSRRRVSALRKAGAREIHLRVSSPPAMFPCFFGIDFPTKTELVAAEKDVDAIRQFIGADSLCYISMEGLMSPFENASDYCTSCFCGKYKVDVTGMEGKHGLEKHASALAFNIQS